MVLAVCDRQESGQMNWCAVRAGLQCLIDRRYSVRLISARLATGPSVLTGGRLFFPRTIAFPIVEKSCKMERMAGRQNKKKQPPLHPCLSAFAQLAAKTDAWEIFCNLMEVGLAGKDFRYGR